MGKMRRTLTILGLFLILATAKSQTGIPRAQAMFIYNFSRLIEWPASYKSGPFVVGVMGTSATLNELSTYTANKTVGSQKIIVKKFNSPGEIGQCHILFVPFGKTKQIPELVKSIGSKSILLITEKNGAINEGSAINFVIVGDKLKFEVKSSNASSRNIRISSKLNEMAYKNL